MIRNLAFASAGRGLACRHGFGRHAARGARLDLQVEPDDHRPARSRSRATDADVAIARAAGRPQVSATAGVNRDLSRSGILETGGKGPHSRPASTSLTRCSTAAASRTTIKAAKTRVEAGRATLRAVEGDVFTEAVAAYMDVIRDRAIVELNANNVKVLDTNLAGDARPLRDRRPHAHRRRPVRSAAVSSAVRSLAIAQGAADRQRGELPPGDRPCAGRAGAAAAASAAAGDRRTRRCRSRSPTIRTCSRSTSQARPPAIDVNVARAHSPADRVRRRSARATSNHLGTADDQFGPSRRAPTTSVGVQARIPIYQGGLPAARIRQAQALAGPVARTDGRHRARGRRHDALGLRHLSGRAGRDPVATRSRCRPTSSRSKARAPNRASAPAPSSTCSMPSRNCSTRRSRS